MTFKRTIVAFVFFAVSTTLAQSTTPVASPMGTPFGPQNRSAKGMTGRSRVGNNRSTGVQAIVTMRQRMEDMESTLAKMHVLLKQMRTKTASSSSKDILAKDNIDMWELIVDHLDKQFEELRTATLAREDFEARRLDMYKQADAKSATIRASEPTSTTAGPATTLDPAPPVAGQSTSGKPAPGESPVATTPTVSQSPN